MVSLLMLIVLEDVVFKLLSVELPIVIDIKLGDDFLAHRSELWLVSSVNFATQY